MVSPQIISGHGFMMHLSRALKSLASEYSMAILVRLKLCNLQFEYKKVLLRERKRHTARRVSSARYAGGGGTPSSHWGVPHPLVVGVPHPVMVGGVPYPVMVGGVPPTIHTWPGGYPRYPSHHPDLGWGTPPPSRPRMGYPPPTIQPWDGVPPQHHPDLGWGTPPTIHPWDGVPPPTIHPWDGVPPTIQTWDGVTPPPHHPDLGWG